MVSSNIDFLSEPPPAHYTLAFEPFLYNQEVWLQLKAGERYSFYAVDHAQQRVLARIHFLIVLDASGIRQAVSLPKSPFGSVEYGHSVDKSTLKAFVLSAAKALKQLSVHAIEIRDCIPAYREKRGISLATVLSEVNFHKQETLVNHHIEINGQPLEEKMHRMERKRLRKCQREGFTFKEESLRHIAFYYQFLADCRSEKGWELSTTLDEVTRAVRKLPNSYRVFALYDNQQCIAACLGVVVNSHIFYDFYHDSLRAYSALSPIVMLLANIYDRLRAEAVTVLDMGTSLTTSLQTFKSHMDGQPTRKDTYVLFPATFGA